MIINNCSDGELHDLSLYIENFITKFKSTDKLNISELIKNSAKNNLIFAIFIWCAGTTIIGLPIVILSILLRGVCLGFTIGTFSMTLGKFSGIIFCLLSLFLQNIILIPTILILGVSSIKLYKSIVWERNKENIRKKVKIHIVILFFSIVALIVSAIMENVVSVQILKKFIKYF